MTLIYYLNNRGAREAQILLITDSHALFGKSIQST